MAAKRKRIPSAPRGRAIERETFVRGDYQAIVRRVVEIPAGKVATYSQIAWLAGLPGRARLVGRVLSSLPQMVVAIPDKVGANSMRSGLAIHDRSQAGTSSNAGNEALACPWHRVINAQGKLSLPINSESYLEQRRRLREEGVLFRNDRIDLRRYQWRTLDESPLLD